MNLFDQIKIGQLIGKYLTGKESKQENSELTEWVNQSEDNQRLFDSIIQEKNIAEAIDEYETYDKELAWKRYLEHIDSLSLRSSLVWWKIAATFFFLISCAGVLAYLSKSNDQPVASNENFTTVTTNLGQNSKVILPDSTVIWLNSGTTLSYNTNFAVSSRKINLKGQAFFEVAKNEHIPLTVTCNNLEVKVLGTKFDVSAYPEDENINVVLESGSIELLKSKDQSVIQKLVPGEKAEFDKQDQELSVNKVDIYNYTSWKDGVLIFKDEPMSTVFEKLERWYNIDIEVKNKKVNQLIFNATLVNESVEEIFDLIKFTCAINYTIVPSKNPTIPVKVILF